MFEFFAKYIFEVISLCYDSSVSDSMFFNCNGLLYALIGALVILANIEFKRFG